VKKLTWWFRIVGAFYLLLALMNLYFMFLGDAQMFRSTIPFPADDYAVRAFVDGWSPFAFEMFGIGTFLLWASRNPLKYLGSVWLVAWLEIWHGVVDDIYLIARGYDVVGYLVFIIVHLIIVLTGVMFARRASAQASEPLRA